jgi:hypothetical protein
MKRAFTPSTRARLATACAFMALLASGACTGSETGNPTASLRLGLRASDPSIATVGETGDGIRVHALWLSVASISAVGCETGAAEKEVSPSATLLNLAEGLEVGEVATGEYCGLHLRLEPAELSTLPMGAPPGATSIATYGERADGVPFVILSAASLDLTIPGPAFTVNEGHSLLLAFDVSAWLRDAVLDGATVTDGLALLDGREHPALTATFDAQLTASLHDDLNADGHVDDDEGALAAIH